MRHRPSAITHQSNNQARRASSFLADERTTGNLDERLRGGDIINLFKTHSGMRTAWR